MAEKTTEKVTKSYGKRPLAFWLVLYVIIGIILYSVGFLIFMHHGSAGNGMSY